MEINLQNTSKIVTIVKDGVEFPARVWEGVTASGIKVQALIIRIAADRNDDLREFEAELSEMRPPSAEVQAFPLRMII